MTPQEFSRRHEPAWQAFEAMLSDGRALRSEDFPREYRRICTHLALARDRHYPLALVERLNRMALEGQQRLYRHQGGVRDAVFRFLSGGFPALVRKHQGLFWISALVFYLPLFLTAYLTWRFPELVYSVLPVESVKSFESMYAPDNPVVGARGDDSRFLMFGYYVQHNTGIGFQTFAGGIFAGIGSLFFLLYNAIQIGAVAGHLIQVGFHDNFLSFVVTHGAFELTAIVLSGMAGLLLGLAFLSPGRLTRRDALILQGREAIRLVYGAAALFLLAALIESFWSSQTAMPSLVKYIAGGCAWLLVTGYFTLAGRRFHAP